MNPASRPRVSGVNVKNVQIQPAPTIQETPKMSETTPETNGSAATVEATAKESALKSIREAWIASGGKMPSTEDGNKLKAAYKAAKAAVAAADVKAAEARAQLSGVCRVIMEKTGARTITIDGVDHIPSVHGKSYFFRARGERTPAVSL